MEYTFTAEQIADGRGTVARHSNGNWRVRISYYQNGKRRNVSQVCGEKIRTEAQARRFLSSWQRQLISVAQEREAAARAEAEAIRHPRWTVPDYVEHVIEMSPANPTTKDHYRTCLNRIRSRFDKIALEELTPDMIADWMEGMENRGLAPATIVHTHALLSQAMRYAVEEDELISRNPCKKRAARPPRRTHKEPNALGASERGRLLDYLETASYRPVRLAAYISILTSMRLGEVCGLRWKDVDMERGIIHVRNAVGIKKGGSYQKPPKTGASIRDIPMPSQLINALKSRRADMWQERIAVSQTTTEAFGELFVIGDISGNYANPSTISKEWGAVANTLELVGTQGRKPTFHDLRHTFITAALTDANADVKTVASMAGHSKVSHTLDIYASADPDAKARLAAKIDEVLRAEREAARRKREEEEKKAARRGTIVPLATGTEGGR